MRRSDTEPVTALVERSVTAMPCAHTSSTMGPMTDTRVDDALREHAQQTNSPAPE